MKNSMFKKWVSTLVIVCLLFSSFGLAYGASTASSDIKGHWAESQVSAWIHKGLVKGYEDGSFKPNDPIIRAEFISLVNRAFGFTEEAVISFSDVIAGSWAYPEVAKAVKAEYITGYADGTIGTNKPISRQEAATIVDRLLKLSSSETVPAAFADSSSIALWAKGSVDAVVAEGIMRGYPEGNSFKPSQSITRAEAVVTLDRAISTQAIVYDKAGTYGPATGVDTINKNVVVQAAGVTLQNLEINGDLLLGEGIGDGDAFLNNVKVTGTVTVQGGGENSIHFNNSVLVEIIINKQSGTGIVRIVSEGTTTVALVTVNSPVHIEEANSTGAGFGNVNLSALLPIGAKVTLAGSFDTVNVSAQQIVVDVPQGTIKNVNANSTATGMSLNLSQGATINSLVLDAVVKLLGQGTIVTAVANIQGSTFEKPVGAPPVIPAPTNPTTPDSGSPGGGSPGGGTPGEGTADTTPPTVVSAAFTSAGGLAITFSELVVATFSNFPETVPYDHGNTEVIGLLGSGTNTITLILPLNYGPSGGFTTTIAISGVTDLAGNVMVSVPNQFVDKYDHTPPTVIKLGDGIGEYGISSGGHATLIFSERISEYSKNIIKKTIAANVDKPLVYSWVDQYDNDLEYSYIELVLTASGSENTLFMNDVIVRVEDENGNSSSNLLLIDTSRDSEPTVLSAAFTSATTLVVTFSEPVVANITDFMPGIVSHINGVGTANSYSISAIAGAGTAVITLTVAGSYELMDAPLVGGDTGLVSIGGGIEDLTGNAMEPVNSLLVTKFDNTVPDQVSAAFTSATEIVITFDEPVNLFNTEQWYIEEGGVIINDIAGSGTSTVTLSVYGSVQAIGKGDYAFLRITENEDIRDLASNPFITTAIFIEKLENISPTVTSLGDRSTVFRIAAGESVTLTFSEEISSDSRTNVEYAITSSTPEEAVLAYEWADNTVLTITAVGIDVTFAESVYVDEISDLYHNTEYKLLLIASEDLIRPEVKHAYFESESMIKIHFSEKVTASLSDFTAGPLNHNDGSGSASGYRITAITVSGRGILNLTIESTDDNEIDEKDSTMIVIGSNLRDVAGNSMDSSDNPISITSLVNADL